MLERLASNLQRRDELPNIELAEYLCQNSDAAGIMEIVDGYKGSDKAVANDCVKVLYEIGARSPKLICDYADEFVTGLCSKNNRLVWGSMMALASIVALAPVPIYSRVDEVIAAYEKGSAITVDNSVSVFAGLCKANREYEERLLPLLIGHMDTCRPKDVPQHAERVLVCINCDNVAPFIEVFQKRLPALTQSQQARLNKLLNFLIELDS